MPSSKASLAFALLVTLVLQANLSHAQNARQDYLNAHNNARAQVGVGPMTWNDALATYAQNYANSRIGDCNLVHSNGPYGENLAMGGGEFTGTAAVNLWVAEKRYYDPNAKEWCVQGKERQCWHYTQVVWRNSVQLGCGRARCSNGSWFVACSYAPRGNIIGQRPY